MARTRWHVLWERRGATRLRRVLAEGDAPGRMLDCGTARGRRLAGARGVAYVRPAPVVARAGAWRPTDGSAGSGYVTNGESREQVLQLPPGTWDLSMRYFSDLPLSLSAGTLQTTLPAYVSDESTFASAGALRWRGGPLTVTVGVPARRRVETLRVARLGMLAATRVDEPGRVVPLADACGRYVDWYRFDRD